MSRSAGSSRPARPPWVLTALLGLIAAVIVVARPGSDGPSPEVEEFHGVVPPEFAFVVDVDDPRPQVPHSGTITTTVGRVELADGAQVPAPRGHVFVWALTDLVNPTDEWLDFSAAALAELRADEEVCRVVRWIPRGGEPLAPVSEVVAPTGGTPGSRVPPRASSTHALLFLCRETFSARTLRTYYGYTDERSGAVDRWHAARIAVTHRVED